MCFNSFIVRRQGNIRVFCKLDAAQASYSLCNVVGHLTGRTPLQLRLRFCASIPARKSHPPPWDAAQAPGAEESCTLGAAGSPVDDDRSCLKLAGPGGGAGAGGAAEQIFEFERVFGRGLDEGLLRLYLPHSRMYGESP